MRDIIVLSSPSVRGPGTAMNQSVPSGALRPSPTRARVCCWYVLLWWSTKTWESGLSWQIRRKSAYRAFSALDPQWIVSFPPKRWALFQHEPGTVADLHHPDEPLRRRKVDCRGKTV